MSNPTGPTPSGPFHLCDRSLGIWLEQWLSDLSAGFTGETIIDYRGNKFEVELTGFPAVLQIRMKRPKNGKK